MLKYFKNIYSNIVDNKPSDNSFGTPKVGEMAQLLREEKYKKATKFYNKLDYHERSLLIDGLALNDNYLNEIFKFCRKKEDNPIANLLSGTANTYIAWQIRTGQRAKDVNYEQFEGFFEYLEKANNDLLNAIDLDKKDPEAYARLIRVYMGLSEKKSAWDCFEDMLEIAPDHLASHMFMFNLLTPKWLGSHNEMKDFALECRNNAGNGLLYIIYLMYIVEVFQEMEDDDLYNAKKYIRKNFKSEIIDLYSKIEIDEIDSLQRYYFHNYFAFLFAVIGNEKFRKYETKKIGENMSFYPWGYVGVLGLKDLKNLKWYE